MPVKNMIFDQYSRYKACADLLKQTNIVEGGSILDVGSGPECLFGQFVHDNTVTYLDPLVLSNSGSGYIKGDIFTSELNGKSFDCVCAVDVFEHVPPENRRLFLERLATLGKNTLIIGFPTSDSSAALETDEIINEQYREYFGRDYFWLQDHRKYGLPSLFKAMEQLRDLGWHCEAVGHGHAPWLQELLGFVICAWEVPSMKNVVLEISRKFNSELYPYDFHPPFYRQFVIASRNPLPSICVPLGGNERVKADEMFRSLMAEAHRQYFAMSMSQLIQSGAEVAQKDAEIAQRDAEIAQRDAEIAQRDAEIVQQEAEIVQQDAEIVQRDAEITLLKQSLNAKAHQVELLLQSLSWRVTSPLRLILRTLQNRGLSANDKRYISQTLRRFMGLTPLSRRFGKSAHPFHLPETSNLVPQSGGCDDVFVWGVIDWHFRLQRPQQLAQELANAGHRVFYFSNTFINSSYVGFEIEDLDGSGRLFQVNLHLGGAATIYIAPPTHDQRQHLLADLTAFLTWADSRQIINLVQHPFWYEIANCLPNSRQVYDCMDHHEGFGNVSPEMLSLENRLASETELLVVTSQWLDNLLAQTNSNRVIIRNACQYGHFTQPPEQCFEDPAQRKIIGYYGAIAEWFDLDLISTVAQSFPDCLILLVGSDTCNAQATLAGLPNVTFTGEVSYADLPYYLYAFDVCLLPFLVLPLTLATNPVKLYEYLSAGKNIVAVDLPEMRQFGDLIQVGKGPDEFISCVQKALATPPTQELIRNRKTFAASQTWSHRAKQLLGAVRANQTPTVSIVVVTYNNLELTKACLHSLDTLSDYPALEIIVVDNASADGTPEYLRDWEKKGVNRKTVLNTENLGFAAANNQGLAAATGSYFVLLNNDTYVTPGWVRTMLTHLRKDSSIGLIGPVTNNIGNEARIEISYQDMEDMIRMAGRHTRAHLGKTFPIRTTAFFCVMMPRDVYQCVGALDEAFSQGYFEDDDYCRRVEQAGRRIVCAEDVFIHHHLSASFSKLGDLERKALFERNKAIYEAKWGKWVPHNYRLLSAPVPDIVQRGPRPKIFSDWQYLTGICNVCGMETRFFYNNPALWREQLTCEHCRTTARYRSIARGILRAINESTGRCFTTLSEISKFQSGQRYCVYDTQPPFYYDPCAYPLPDMLKATGWIDVMLSQFKPTLALGSELEAGITNQNLERLTFADESFDLVITSDVMEHVRLDDHAHKEIYRVLKPGGIYIFTVPHDRSRDETQLRVAITDPDDPAKDIHLLEPEYHGDTNSDEDSKILSYRVYGRDLERQFADLGFEVEYSRVDHVENGILNAELYYCRKAVRGA